jgi:hypothetical protein
MPSETSFCLQSQPGIFEPLTMTIIADALSEISTKFFAKVPNDMQYLLSLASTCKQWRSLLFPRIELFFSKKGRLQTDLIWALHRTGLFRHLSCTSFSIKFQKGAPFLWHLETTGWTRTRETHLEYIPDKETFVRIYPRLCRTPNHFLFLRDAVDPRMVAIYETQHGDCPWINHEDSKKINLYEATRTPKRVEQLVRFLQRECY